MIRCQSDGDGVRVAVHARPRASRNAVLGEHAGALTVAVTAPPDAGRANDAVARTLARALGVRPSAVTLVSGRASRNKTFHVAGVTCRRVQALADAGEGKTTTSAGGR